MAVPHLYTKAHKNAIPVNIKFAGSLRFRGCVLHAGFFSLRVSPRVFFCAARTAFFFLILYDLFWGGRETSSSEALFLSLPTPLPLFQHWGGLPLCFVYGVASFSSSVICFFEEKETPGRKP